MVRETWSYVPILSAAYTFILSVGFKIIMKHTSFDCYKKVKALTLVYDRHHFILKADWKNPLDFYIMKYSKWLSCDLVAFIVSLL